MPRATGKGRPFWRKSFQLPPENLSRYLDSVFGPESEDDMTPYHSLSECTLSPAERLIEAELLLKMILDHEDKLYPNERQFVFSLQSSCSVKQLFWLRDIKDRVTA